MSKLPDNPFENLFGDTTPKKQYNTKTNQISNNIDNPFENLFNTESNVVETTPTETYKPKTEIIKTTPVKTTTKQPESLIKKVGRAILPEPIENLVFGKEQEATTKVSEPYKSITSPWDPLMNAASSLAKNYLKKYISLDISSEQRQKEFDEVLKKEGVDITKQPIISQGYKEPTGFTDSLVEGVKYGYSSQIKPSIGYLVESIGLEFGIEGWRKWGQEFGDKQVANLYKQGDLFRPTNLPEFSEGGYKDIRYYGRTIGETIPFVATVMGATTAVALATKNPTLVKGTSFATSMALEKASAYKDMIDRGIKPVSAAKASTVYGTIAAIIENSFGFKPAEIVLGKPGKEIVVNSFKEFLKKELPKMSLEFLGNVMSEGAEEGAQQLAQNLITKWLDSSVNIWENVMESIPAGMIGALPFGATDIMGSVADYSRMKAKASLPQNQNNPKILEDLDIKKNELDFNYELKKEKVIDIPQQEGDQPLVSINVSNLGDNKWAFDYSVNTNEVGLSSQFTNNNIVNSKDEAINIAKKSILEWTKNEIDNVSDEVKVQLQNIIDEVSKTNEQETVKDWVTIWQDDLMAEGIDVEKTLSNEFGNVSDQLESAKTKEETFKILNDYFEEDIKALTKIDLNKEFPQVKSTVGLESKVDQVKQGIEVYRGEGMAKQEITDNPTIKVNGKTITDQGQFGRGIYYTDNKYTASTYGEPKLSKVALKKPLVLNEADSKKLMEQFKTNGKSKTSEELQQKVINSDNLTKALIDSGYDGVVVVNDQGNTEIVDFRNYEPIKIEKPTQVEQVKKVTSESPKTIKEIAIETNIKEANVRRILGVGAKEGTFTRIEKGVYILNKDGSDMAYIHTGDSVEILPKLVDEGVKVDMIFLDIPYDTPAVRGGNRGVRYNLVSVDQFSKVLDNVIKLSKTENTPVIHMYSQAESGKVAMKKYNDLFIEKGFIPVGKGEYQKTFKSGEPVTNVRGEVSKPEGILVFNMSGKLDKDLTNLNFKLVRPTGYQTEKPAEMIRKMIEMTTNEGDTILDPFAGSGVVGEQAIETGRKVILIEKNKEVVEKNIIPKLEKTKPTPRFAKPKSQVVSKDKILKKVESLLKKKANLPILNNAKIKDGELNITDIENFWLKVPGFKESDGIYKIAGGELVKTNDKVVDFPFNDNIVNDVKNKIGDDKNGISINKMIEAIRINKDIRGHVELDNILLSSINGKLNIKSTDAFRGYNRNINIDWNSDKEIMLSRNSIEKVFSLLSGDIKFFIDDSNNFIKIIDSKGVVITSSLFEGKYPILGTIIEQNKYQNKFIIDRQEFIDAIKTIKPFTDSLKSIEISKIDSNTLKIYGENTAQNLSKTVNIKFTEQKYNNNIKQSNDLDIVMPIALAQERQAGKERIISLNWKYVEDALNGYDSKDIVLFNNDDNSPVIFMSKDGADVMDMTTTKEKKPRISKSGLASTEGGKLGTFEELAGIENKTEPELKLYEEVKKLVAKYAKSIGENYLPSNTLGVFYPSTKNIRIKGMNDLSVASHEITHFLDHSYDITKQLMGVKSYSKLGKPIYESTTYKLRKSLTNLYLQYYPTARKEQPLELRLQEGFATLLQKYIEMPSTITKQYPDLVNEFLTKDGLYYKPVMSDIINDLKDIVKKYQGLSALDKIGTRVIDNQVNVNKDYFLNFAEKVKTEIADNIYPIEKLAKQAGIQLTKKDPSLWLRQYNSSNTLILNNINGNRGYWGWRDGELKKLHDYNFKTLISDLHKEKIAEDFGYWLVARREFFAYKELETLQENIETARAEMLDIAIQVKQAQDSGYDLGEFTDDMVRTKANFENAQQIYNEAKEVLRKDGFTQQEVTEAYEKNKERFNEYSEQYDNLVREDLNFLHDQSVGLIGDKEYKELTHKEGYASFKRYFYDELVGEESRPIKKIRFGNSKVSSMLKRVGSQKPIINPLFSALTNHAEATRKGLKQVIYNRIGEIAGKFPDLFQRLEVTAIPDDRGRFIFPQEKDPAVIMARINYKRMAFLTDATIKRTVDEVLNVQNISIFEKLLMGASRFFTKGTTGLFPGFAITNYTVDQVSAVAQSREKYLPIYDPLNTIVKILNKNNPQHQLIEEYMVLGGERQTLVGWQDMSPNELFDRMSKEREGLLKVVDLLNSGMNILAIPSQWSEVMTRATEYIKARESGKSQIVALEEAGRVTAPFHHVGRWGGGRVGQTFIKSIPFFNPGIEVLAQVAETLETPEGRMRYGFTALAITAASIASLGLLFSVGSDEQKDLYADLHPDELNKYIWLPYWDKKTLIKIRVPDQMNVIATLVNMMIADKKLNANYSAGEYINAGASWLPAQFDITQPTKLLMAWIPQLIKPGVLTLAGVKDYPKIIPLESQSQKAKPAEFRYTEATSPVAKWLGKTFNLSPIKIDYLLTGYAGRATGFLTGKPGIYNPLKSVIREYYFTSGRQVQFYYDLKEKNDQDYYAYKHKLRDFKLGERSGILKLKNKLKVVDSLLEDYRDLDLEKNPNKGNKLRNRILKEINKIQQGTSTKSSSLKEGIKTAYNNTFATPTAEAFSLNPFKKKSDIMTPISEILPPESLKQAPKTYNLSNEVYVGQKGASKGELKGYEGGKPVYWASFPSLESNIEAVKNDINIKLNNKPNMTIRQLVERRSPPSDDNNVDDILFTISDELWKQYTGKNGEVIFNGRTKINTMSDKQITALIKAIMVAEGHPELRYKTNI